MPDSWITEPALKAFVDVSVTLDDLDVASGSRPKAGLKVRDSGQ